MIPIKEGLYTEIDFSTISDPLYVSLLRKEYNFCMKIFEKARIKAEDIYQDQITSGQVKQYYCNFKLLEMQCLNYTIS